MFFNGDGTLNMAELGEEAVGFFIEDAALGLVLANAQTPQTDPPTTRTRPRSSRR